MGSIRPSPSTLLRCLAHCPAPRTICTPALVRIPSSRRPYHLPRTSAWNHRPQPVPKRKWPIAGYVRSESSVSSNSTQPTTSTTAPDSRLERDQVPAYELTFTCKACTTRSSHRVSKQGYHHGTVLITCPGCKNRHLISDHMKIFSDKSLTIEDLMREKGQLVKRGSLSSEGDVEFWDDGSTTPRSAHFIANSTTKSDPDAEEGRLTEPPPSQNNEKA